MQTRVRLARLSGATLLAATLWGLAPAGLSPASAVEAAPVSLTDAVGDTLVDPDEKPITAPRADIVSSAARSGPDGITLSARMSQTVDPKTDPNWAGDSLPSYLTWRIDVDGDREDDFEIEYSFEPDEKTLQAFLASSIASFEPPADCDPQARFSPADGYAVVIDAKCLGNPARFSYQVEVFYNTDARNDEADIASDHSPDDGWAGPVAVTLRHGVTPGTLPPPSQTSTAPRTPASSSTVGTTPSAPAPNAAPVAPQQAAPGPAPSRTAPVTAAPAAPDLARTGLGDRTLRVTWFAVGVALVGVGLLIGNRRPALGEPAAPTARRRRVSTG